LLPEGNPKSKWHPGNNDEQYNELRTKQLSTLPSITNLLVTELAWSIFFDGAAGKLAACRYEAGGQIHFINCTLSGAGAYSHW